MLILYLEQLKMVIIIMIRTYKKIFSFARRTIKSIKKQELVQIEENLKDEIFEEFEPLHRNPEVQEKITSQVLKNLSYEGEDPNPTKLVNRPSKGVVWGLGGQLVMASRKMQLEGIKAEVDEVINFLELQQVKNIYVHDWQLEEDKSINKRRYAILGSCFSARHCWRAAIELKNGFNKNVIIEKNKKDPITALISGKKDDEWMMVAYKDFEVNLMTEEQREGMDLEWKWNNPTAEETIDKYVQMQLNRRGRKSQIEDLD